MFENKFVSLPSHLKTIEPMEVHRELRTMRNTETSNNNYKHKTIMTKNLVLFLFISLFALSTKAYAETLQSEKAKQVKVDNLYYSLVGNEAHVMDHKSHKKLSGDLVIPSSIEYKGQNYTVTTIMKYAFLESILRSVVIPESIKEIEEDAFCGCRLLKKVNLPSGITRISSGTFFGCESLASINIPEGVTCIEDRAFEGCGHLTSISLPEGLTTIGKRAFLACHWLESVVLPKSLKTLGERAFAACYDLKSVTMYKGITSYTLPFENSQKLKTIYTDDKNLTRESLIKGDVYKDYTFKIKYIYSQPDENSVEQVDLELVKREVNSGNKKAMITLGELYEKGQGVEQSDLKAEEMYRKAMDNNLNNETARKKMANIHKKILEEYRKSLIDGYRSNYKDVKLDAQFLNVFLNFRAPESENLLPLALELIEAEKVLDAINGDFQKYIGFVRTSFLGPKNKPEWWPEHVDSDTKKLADALTIAKSMKSKCGFEQFFSTAANKLILERQQQQKLHLTKEEKSFEREVKEYEEEQERISAEMKAYREDLEAADTDDIPEIDERTLNARWEHMYTDEKRKWIEFKDKSIVGGGFFLYYQPNEGYRTTGSIIHYKTAFDAIAAYYVKKTRGLYRKKNRM